MDIENINGKANAGITLGTIGTALSGLQWLGGNGLFSREGSGIANAAATVMCGDSAPVSRYEMDMAMKLANKDSELALLKSEQNTEVKMTEVYERLASRLLADERAQADWNTAQAVNNATMSGAIATLQNSCSQITKLVVPNTAICPGWGNVTITPATSTTTNGGTVTG